jgi:hypothetical protein
MRSSPILALVLTLVIPVSSLAIMCPSGFRDLNNGERSLGCIQEYQPEDPQSAGSALLRNWGGGSLYCFEEFGGRLPTPVELKLPHDLGMDLQGFTTDLELTDDVEWVPHETTGACCSGAVTTVSRTGGISFMRGLSVPAPFRCFIPATTVASAAVPGLPAWLALINAPACIGVELPPMAGREAGRTRPCTGSSRLFQRFSRL